jgi:ferredoxin-NADP reductase/Na+-translocating ferredoxin:NAD+ oxidoreductase RnfD subunit
MKRDELRSQIISWLVIMKTFVRQPILFLKNTIDAVTMYRLVLYGLLALVATGLGLGLFSVIPQTIGEQLRSLFVVLTVAFFVNEMCARLWRAHTNYESVAITALIIFFLVSPARSVEGLFIIALVTSIAMLSKYLLAIRSQHIANPAAVGILALSLFGYYESTWWIGTPSLFIPLLIVGSVVVYKVRKWVPVLSFLAVGFVVFLFEEWRFFGVLENWTMFWISYPALFLAFFMLTEPFTMPPTKKLQLFYGALVGFLSSTTFFQPVVKMSPELALVLGNLLMYPFTLRRKLFLTLKERRELAPNIFEYIFTKPAGLRFVAGQYLEWMLPHVTADTRGVRRYFTIASSPTEPDIRLALKTANPGSTYKVALAKLKPGDQIIASQLAGDFTLSSQSAKKIAWIAGGIGVTPFRSQVQYLLDSQELSHDIVLFYCVETLADLAYGDLFERASTVMPFKMVRVVTDKNTPLTENMEHGFIDEAMLQRQVPDYLERQWYISGPPRMVDAYTTLLRKVGVPRRHIIRDFFPGLA